MLNNFNAYLTNAVQANAQLHRVRLYNVGVSFVGLDFRLLGLGGVPSFPCSSRGM